ncbi:MAG: hypothetical protein MMC33_010166 [Icmadophila ericetorum]|nr:hypothetical protein [Icmadophila ericetorum]
MSYYIYTPPNAGRLRAADNNAYLWYPGYIAQPANTIPTPDGPANPVPKPPPPPPPMTPSQYLASMPYVPSPYVYPYYSQAPIPTVYQPYPHYPQYYYAVPPVLAAPASVPKKDPPPPTQPIYWYGNTTAEINAQNATIAATKGVVPVATGAAAGGNAAPPAGGKAPQLVPFKQEDEPQYWCRELEGDWTLRTVEEINKECKLGFWTYTNEGHPFYTRLEKSPKKD